MNASTAFNWCFSTLGCPERSLAEIAATANRFDISRVELRAVSDRLDLPALFTETFGDAPAMQQWLTENRIQIASFDSSAKLIGCSPAAKEELLGFGEWAHALGVKGLRVFDGGTFQPQLSDADRDEAVAFLTWWDDICAERGWQVELWIETHDALCRAATITALAEAYAGDLALLWDAHHTWKKGGEALEVTWSVVRRVTRHIHFKDSISEPSARHPFTYVPLGEGEFPLGQLFDLLRADGFAGAVSLEWERKWHPYLAPIEDALARLAPFRR